MIASVVYRNLESLGLVETVVFLGVMMESFVYAWANGVLAWE